MRSHNLEETRAIADAFLAKLEPDDSVTGGATVVALHGDLGAGKTAFVQAAAKLLGVTATVNSPTFIIEKIYELPPPNKFHNLVHFDCYRLERPEEAVHLNWAEQVSDPGNLIFIEWPERIASLLPGNTHHLAFTFINETEREIELA